MELECQFCRVYWLRRVRRSGNIEDEGKSTFPSYGRSHSVILQGVWILENWGHFIIILPYNVILHKFLIFLNLFPNL